MKTRRFYDLAIQVAIIRPGPIQGKRVHACEKIVSDVVGNRYSREYAEIIELLQGR